MEDFHKVHLRQIRWSALNFLYVVFLAILKACENHSAQVLAAKASHFH